VVIDDYSSTARDLQDGFTNLRVVRKLGCGWLTKPRPG
jgi:hypothetical protein